MAEDIKRIGANAVRSAPWKTETYWDREQTKFGQRVNDVIDGIDNIRARVRGAISLRFKADPWTAIDNGMKRQWRAEVPVSVAAAAKRADRADAEFGLSIGRPRTQAIEHQETAAMLRGDRINPPKHHGEDVAKQIHSHAVGSAQYHLSEARKLRETNSATDPFARLSQAEKAWASAPTGASHSRHDPAPVAQHTLGL